MALIDDIRSFLTANLDRNVQAHVDRVQRQHKMTLFGEAHVGLSRKARFFADVIRRGSKAGNIRFHASEHFHNDQNTHGRAVDTYLSGSSTNTSVLPAGIRTLSPILDAVRAAMPNFGVVFAGTPANNNRDQRLFDHFSSSRRLHITAGRFGADAHGHFHLGGDHASRTSYLGTTRTTCEHLVADGWSVYVYRMSVNVKTRSTVTAAGGFVMTSGEFFQVQPLGGGTDIDMLPLLNAAAAGNTAPYVVNITGSGSPFHRVQFRGATRRIAISKMWDALIHLP